MQRTIATTMNCEDVVFNPAVPSEQVLKRRKI